MGRVVRRARRKKEARQETTPIFTLRRGGRRRVRPPWRREAMRPMKPRSRPLPEAVRAKRSWVMKGRENSIPEKKRMNVRWVKLRIKWELVRLVGAVARVAFVVLVLVLPLAWEAPFAVGVAREGRVSGRYM